MEKKRFIFTCMLVLALIITLILGTIYRREEGYVNTKSCLSLSPDQVIKSYEMCNNLVGSDPSHCEIMIEALSCPIEGVAINALLTHAAATDSAKPSVSSTYAPFESSEKK